MPSLEPHTPLQGHFRVLRPLRSCREVEQYLVADQERAATCLLEVFGAAPREGGQRETFQREVTRLQGDDGEHVAELRAAGWLGPRPWLISRFCAGGSIDEWIDLHGPMPEALAIDVVADVAAGLAALHRRAVVHGDLRPSNVLIDLQGRCVLGRAGRARLLASAGLEVPPAARAESFLAPEQRGGLVQGDARADIYGAGALLFALVTGRAPGALHLAGLDHPRFTSLSASLVDVIVHCTRKEPSHRVEDADELRDRLVQVRRLVRPLPSATPSLVAAGWQGLDGPLLDLEASLPPPLDPKPREPAEPTDVWSRLKRYFS